MIINQVTLSTIVDAADLTADDNFDSVLQANEHVTVLILSQLPTNNATVSEISNYTNNPCSFGRDTDQRPRLRYHFFHPIRWNIVVTSSTLNNPEEGGRLFFRGRSSDVDADGSCLLFAVRQPIPSVYFHPSLQGF